MAATAGLPSPSRPTFSLEGGCCLIGLPCNPIFSDRADYLGRFNLHKCFRSLTSDP